MSAHRIHDTGATKTEAPREVIAGRFAKLLIQLLDLVAGVGFEVASLSESTSIVVAFDRVGEPVPLLVMTVPAHFTRRAQLAPGVPVTVAIRSEGIHLIAMAQQ